MKVLITGGTGFIGSRLALRYLEKGHAVRVLGQENTPTEAKNRQLLAARGAKVTLASVTERERLFELLHGVDVVYHLAAAQHEANVPDQRFWEVNVTGTKNILEGSINAHIKRFIHGSTIGVYGSALEGCLDEQSPLHPNNIYGITKLEGEKLVLSFRKELPGVVIRIAETYGPGDHRLLKLFKGIQKKVFFIIGSGKNIHHLIYIDDLIEGLFLAATVKEAAGQVFVLSGKEALTTTTMVETIAKQLGTRIPAFHLPLSVFLVAAVIMEKICRPIGVNPPLHRRRLDFFQKNFLFSPERPSQILGFVPRVGFEQGVAETARWYGENGYL
jgi:nucleoside-diphosphate-sugar epimerase